MKNKIILLTIVLLIIGILLGPVRWLSKKQVVIEPLEIIEAPVTKMPENIGYGWSQALETEIAIKEAIAMVKKDLIAAKFVLLFSTADYDHQKIIEEITKAFGPEIKIYGGTSFQAVINQDGFHQGQKGSLALLASSSPKIDLGVAGVDLNDFASAQEAGQAVISQAIENAGRKSEIKPDLVLMTSAPGQEEKILQGIKKVIGQKAIIFGGSSADNDLSGQWKQFANQKIFSNGISVAVFYTDLKIGFSNQSGYLKTEKRGVVTRAEGRIIYEIDHQPAAEVYNDWTNGLIDQELESGGEIFTKTSFYPLVQAPKDGFSDSSLFPVFIHPLSVEANEKSLIVFADAWEGEEVELFYGTWETLLNRVSQTVTDVLETKEIATDKILFGFYDYCAGDLLSLPEDQKIKIPLLINRELKGMPFVGTFTFGEQLFYPELGSFHNNLANFMIVFVED